MKKILALLLVLVMATSVIACGKTENPEESTPPVENVETPVENDETEEGDKVEKPEESTKPSATPSATPSEKPQESAKPSEKPAEEPKTVGTKLLADFNQKAKSGTALSIAEAVINSANLPISPVVMEVAPGNLAGFDNYEVTGFKSGAVFQPMMGTIPFVGYVFEVEDGVSASDFVANLKKNANKRWNICTEAEEMVTGIVGNKVFFVMCPKSFEE